MREKPHLTYLGLGFTVGTCGESDVVKLEIDWLLLGGSNGDNGINGWVVQHIQSSYEVFDANGNLVKGPDGKPLKVAKDFYKVWRVTTGKAQGGDAYEFGLDSGTRGMRGNYHVVGVVGFFGDNEIRPNPSSWTGREPDANGLPNRTGTPGGWTSAGAMHRTLDVEWNCTDPNGNYPRHDVRVS